MKERQNEGQKRMTKQESKGKRMKETNTQMYSNTVPKLTKQYCQNEPEIDQKYHPKRARHIHTPSLRVCMCLVPFWNQILTRFGTDFDSILDPFWHHFEHSFYIIF